MKASSWLEEKCVKNLELIDVTFTCKPFQSVWREWRKYLFYRFMFLEVWTRNLHTRGGFIRTWWRSLILKTLKFSVIFNIQNHSYNFKFTVCLHMLRDQKWCGKISWMSYHLHCEDPNLKSCICMETRNKCVKIAWISHSLDCEIESIVTKVSRGGRCMKRCDFSVATCSVGLLDGNKSGWKFITVCFIFVQIYCPSCYFIINSWKQCASIYVCLPSVWGDHEDNSQILKSLCYSLPNAEVCSLENSEKCKALYWGSYGWSYHP